MYVKAESKPFRLKMHVVKTDVMECDIALATPTHVRIVQPVPHDAKYHVELTYHVESPIVADNEIASLRDNKEWPATFSPAVVEFIRGQRTDAHSRLQAVLNGLRWRCRATGVLTTSVVNQFVSLDGVAWQHLPIGAIPGEILFEVSAHRIKPDPNKIVNAITESLASGELMPLSRELLLEAYELQNDNRRSALVLLLTFRLKLERG